MNCKTYRINRLPAAVCLLRTPPKSKDTLEGLFQRRGRMGRLDKGSLGTPTLNLRLAVGFFDGQFCALESDAAVRAIAKRFVH